MLKRLDLRRRGQTARDDLADLLPRPQVGDAVPAEIVRELIAEVRGGGDAAVRELTARFDGVDVADTRVPISELSAAWKGLSPGLRSAMETAHRRILEFHWAEAAAGHTYERDGVTVRSVSQPVDRAGIYVPGGLAAYPSTVLMTVLVARAAGVDDIVLCSPPDPDGDLAAPVLAAAHLCGVAEVHRVGGVQAVAALAYGTETIRPADVVAGPGNAWVATAKQLVAGDVGVASAFAGPSEIVVIADATCPPAAAATDVVLQAEHGPGGRAWLVTWDEGCADAVCDAIGQIVDLSPRRDETLATLEADGFVCLVDGPAQAADVANFVAPEHLQLMCDGAEELVSSIRHAGAVFIGPWAPASVGDYVAGPSHVLPTAGTARFAGALTTDDFTKRMHVVDVSEAGFDQLAPAVAELAEAEGLWAHAASVSRRKEWTTTGVRP
ncbi:histidinol dehydrogenase [Candidatus Poriferisodalis sp.]|uniref:histidinol dehydrogenase n=1 Tax=Candidatus Poriferisodalis sp. TaxID=3101277 RepID=UPI003B02E867